jgi:hypothetical protein
MSINVSYYDVTQIDYQSDSVDDGAIPQSGSSSWIPLALAYKTAKFAEMQERIKHRGNLQTLMIDVRAKKHLAWELEYLALKYDATSPAYDWWDIISKGFYGGATGAPVTRPSALWIGAKINRTTPEYWTAHGAKIEEFTIKGDMTKDHMSVLLKGIARGFSFNTTNYVQGTATRRADPAKVPIIPAQDTLIKINNVDLTTVVADWNLTMTRKFEQRGRSATVAGSGTQIALDGSNFREFVPNTFDGKLSIKLDPYSTITQNLIDYLADTALATCQLDAQSGSGSFGKSIKFLASKTQKADQQHATEKSPSIIELEIDGSSFQVDTL